MVEWETVDRTAKEMLTNEQFAIWELGVTHNKSGGSRQSQELKAVYDRAVKRLKETYGVDKQPGNVN